MIFMVHNSFGEPQYYLSRLCSDVHTLQRDMQPSSGDFVIFHSNFQRKYYMYSKVQRTRVIHQVANTLARSSSFPLKITVENHKITAGRLQIALNFLLNLGITKPVFLHKKCIENGGSG